jgi:hypothetical protein
MNGKTLKDLLGTSYRMLKLSEKKITFFITALEKIAIHGKVKNDVVLAKLLNEILLDYKEKFEKASLSLSQELRGIRKKVEEESKNE